MSEKQIIWRNVDDLELWQDNPNQGDIGAIVTSINRFGYNDVVAIWNGRIQGGNHRARAIAQLYQGAWIPGDNDRMARIHEGDLQIGCLDVSHLESEQEANAFGIALNRTTRLGEDDDAKLAALLQDIAAVDDTLLQATGYDGDDLDNLLRDLGELETPDDPGAQVDKADELREQWQTERGQLWIIPSASGNGEHRILCGDSTSADDVARLMGGVKAQGAFTSPPYAEQRKAQYGGTPSDEYVDWWGGVQTCVRSHLKEDGSFFVNIKAHCEDGERVLYVMDLVLAMRRRWDWRFVDELCWVRNGYPGGYTRRFKNSFEPVYHFAVGDDIKFCVNNVVDDRPQDTHYWGMTGNGSGLGGTVPEGGIGVRPSNVLNVETGEVNTGTKAHPATYPIRLPEFFIKAYSDNSDLWYDPFLGSGTTIVACEQTGRVGYGMEISPAYVAVCLQRLADMGLEPRLNKDET